MTTATRRLLNLHALSTATQTAHADAVSAGLAEDAECLLAIGEDVADMIGALVTSESKRNRAAQGEERTS